ARTPFLFPPPWSYPTIARWSGGCSKDFCLLCARTPGKPHFDELPRRPALRCRIGQARAGNDLERERRQALGRRRRPGGPALLHQLLIGERDRRWASVKLQALAVMDERQEGPLAPTRRNAAGSKTRLDVLVLPSPAPVVIGIAVHRAEVAV